MEKTFNLEKNASNFIHIEGKTGVHKDLLFDVMFTENAKQKQHMIRIDLISSLASPKAIFSENEPTYLDDIFASNIRAIENSVTSLLERQYGNNNGGITNTTISLRKEPFIRECIDIAKNGDRKTAYDANALQKLRSEIETAFKKGDEPRQQKLRLDNSSVIPAGAIRDSIAAKIFSAGICEDAVDEVNKRFSLLHKGYKAVHVGNVNSEPYFIIINMPGKEPLAKTVAVDKNISQDALKEFLKKEANGFINEHVRNTDDLNGMSVRAEKADDLSNEGQRELYRQIGSNAAEKGFENSVEIAR